MRFLQWRRTGHHGALDLHCRCVCVVWGGLFELCVCVHYVVAVCNLCFMCVCLSVCFPCLSYLTVS